MRSGMTGGFAVLLRPRATLRRAGDGRRLGIGLVVVSVWALTGLALSLLSLSGGDVSQEQFPELPPEEVERLRSGLRVVLPLLGLTLPFVWWAGLSALLHLATRLFGGRGTLAATFAYVGVACAPWAVAGAVQVALAPVQNISGAAALGILSLALSFAALAWHAALVLVGIRKAARVGHGGVAGSCALAGVGCAMAALFLGITLAVFAVSISGLSGG